ncbi:MAG: serine hydrolase domain-containing protein [Planctomycetota bacterium]
MCHRCLRRRRRHRTFRHSRPHQAALALLLLAAPPLTAPRVAAQVSPCHDFTAIDAAMTRMVATVAPNGASVSIARATQPLFKQHYGGFDPSTVARVASATKWLSGAVLMSLVDSGALDLDVPVAQYLPQFTGLKGTITVRQMFSHTSGLPGDHPAAFATTLTLEQAVNAIARTPLRTVPGTDFYYGNASMHVAGRVAEVVSGKDWATLFAERIAMPLGMTSTDYQGTGAPQNPLIAGGARSSLADMANFVRMLANGGRFRGRQVLSAAALDEMLRDQTGGVPVTFAPPTAPAVGGYGIGCWVERNGAQGRAVELSSPGAFGCTPWIDLERGTSGVMFVEAVQRQTDPTADQIRAHARDELRYVGVSCYGSSSPTCSGFARAFTSDLPASGNAGFALRGRDAPPTTLGLLIAGTAPALSPRRVFGVELHVALDPGTVLLTVASDGRGDVVVPAPLVGVPVGSAFFAQLVFGPQSGCPGPAPLVTTHGMGVRVQP